jgi:hypothetical protein
LPKEVSGYREPLLAWRYKMNEDILAVGRDAQLAMLLSAKWQEEIEQAISRVKKSCTRSQSDKWFRKQWYRAAAIRRKRERRAAKQGSSPTFDRLRR